jgi:hypothetical protein
MVMIEVDMERLRAYEKLLAIPIDKIENIKSQFVGYLMRRELEMKGELE